MNLRNPYPCGRVTRRGYLHKAGGGVFGLALGGPSGVCMMYRATLRVVVLSSACLLVGCRAEEPNLDVKSIGARDASDSRLWVINRAASGGQLAFAVFEGGPRTDEGLTSAVTRTHNANNDGRT